LQPSERAKGQQYQPALYFSWEIQHHDIVLDLIAHSAAFSAGEKGQQY